jgi:ketose-bisphosphate aldolase
MLVPLPHLLAKAQAGGYAIGYFEAWDSYSLEAVVEAAEAENAPVIIGFGCMMVSPTWLDSGGIGLLGRMGRAIAERTNVPVAFLLNEAHTYAETLEGIEAGFNAVMLDTSSWETPRAVEQVRELVSVAHAHGIAVEAELGRLPDAVGHDIDRSSAALTDPEAAAAFVAETGVDCLAVAIGNIHLLTTEFAPIDLAHLARIHARVQIPLVIHGGTSFPPSAVPEAIAQGAAKFNVGTILKKIFLQGVLETSRAYDADVNVHDVLGSHKEADLLVIGKQHMREKVREFLRIYHSSGHAHDF